MNRSAVVSSSSVEIPGRTSVRTSSSVAATMLPARAMISISFGDFSVTIYPLAFLPTDRATHPLRNLFDAPRRRDPGHPAPQLVPVEHRCRLAAIGLEPPLDRLGLVVAPALDATAFLDARENLSVGHVEEQHL